MSIVTDVQKRLDILFTGSREAPPLGSEGAGRGEGGLWKGMAGPGWGLWVGMVMRSRCHGQALGATEGA